MGAKVAPSKSFNFATHRGVKRWLSQKTWKGIDANIQMVDDLRYLGAHITTTYDCISGTLDDRINKAITQLQRLRFCPASTETKIKAIATKIYAGALYGIEATQLGPAKIAKLSAAVIDTFKSRNNSHNANRFYATLTPAKNDLDPAAQILARRVMQVRRTCAKKPGAEEKFKRTIKKYAAIHKDQQGRWPRWYMPNDSEDTGETFAWPSEQPHPSTQEYDKHWNKCICPLGPTGLLIEAALWHGLVIDDQLVLRQKAEQPIDILKVPYQNLNMLTLHAAAVARGRAEWGRNTSSTIVKECREIDRDATLVDPQMEQMAKGIVRTTQMGSQMHKCGISKFNQDIIKACPYCEEDECTSDHLRWKCKYFDEKRRQIDEDIASIPAQWLPMNIRSGIAPAMRIDGKATYWGKNFDDTLSDKTMKLLGLDVELHEQGKKEDDTKANKDALEIINNYENRWMNARQVLLKYKMPHGSGTNPQFPTRSQIEGNMQHRDQDFFVDIYGDGSLTDPTSWWAALGGFGTWMPKWCSADATEPSQNETSLFGAAVGQTGSSTRMELMAWLSVLAMPIRSNYATDSAAMLGKARRLIEAAAKQEENRATASESGARMAAQTQDSSRSGMKNPFGKPWAVQTDGDLWEQAWAAVTKRGATNQRLRKVKGHATKDDVDAGRATQEDKHGNDMSDENADKGVQAIGGAGLVRLARWTTKRHANYKKFMGKIHNFIHKITVAEKEEREKEAVIQKATLGYDPSKAIKSRGTIRKENTTSIRYSSLQLPPPIRGKHRFRQCQCMYEQAHRFLAARKWAHAQPESEAGGITWLELFILFDTKGGRTASGQHQKSKEATERARRRKGRTRKGSINEVAAVAKASLDEELKHFKAVCRYILSNDLPEEQRDWFKMETRPQWRRLALLGIEGNQPAMAAFCQTTQEEDDAIAEAIIRQKVGANPKVVKAHIEATKARSEEGQSQEILTLYRKAHIACGTTVRWKRSIADDGLNDEEVQQVDQDQDDAPTYTSRLLSCIRCHHPNETSWMQLRSLKGFRAIHCRSCGYQQLSGRNKCQCGNVWHHCQVHRVDPTKHLSRKAPKWTKAEQDKRRRAKAQEMSERGGRKNSWKRKYAPPIVEEGIETIRSRKGKKARTTADKNLKLKPMRTLAPILRCDPQRLERIRCKEKANKETAQHLSSSSRDPMGVELAEEYRSTPSAASIMARSPTIQLSRANEIHTTKDNLKRKDFDKQIQRDIERQAARPGKTTRTCEERPNHAKTNLGSIGGDLHNQCDNTSSTARPTSGNKDEGHQRPCRSEFKNARQKTDHEAILRLLSGGASDSKPPERA